MISNVLKLMQYFDGDLWNDNNTWIDSQEVL